MVDIWGFSGEALTGFGSMRRSCSGSVILRILYELAVVYVARGSLVNVWRRCIHDLKMFRPCGYSHDTDGLIMRFIGAPFDNKVISFHCAIGFPFQEHPIGATRVGGEIDEQIAACGVRPGDGIHGGIRRRRTCLLGMTGSGTDQHQKDEPGQIFHF